MPVTPRAMVEHLTDEVWNEARYGELKRLVARNFALRDATTGRNIAGIEGLEEFISNLRSSFPNMQMATEEIIAESSSIVQRWTIQGTHMGEYLGIRPTNKQIVVRGVSVFRIRNGMITDMDIIFDRLRVLEQIGAGIATQAAA